MGSCCVFMCIFNVLIWFIRWFDEWVGCDFVVIVFDLEGCGIIVLFVNVGIVFKFFCFVIVVLYDWWDGVFGIGIVEFLFGGLLFVGFVFYWVEFEEVWYFEVVKLLVGIISDVLELLI